MPFFRNMTIRARSFITILAGLLAIFWIQTVQSSTTFNTITNMILEERLALARTVARDLDADLGKILSRLEYLSTNPQIDLTDGDMSPERELLQVFHDPDQEKYIFILDRDGKLIFSEPSIPEEIDIFRMMDCPHVQNTLQTGQSDIACIAHGSDEFNPVVAPVVPIYDRQGGIVGALGAAIDPASTAFSELLLGAIQGMDMHAQVVDADGYVLVHTNRENLFTRSAHADLFIPLIKNNQSFMSIQPVVEDGKSFRAVIAFAPLSSVPWGVAIEQSEADLLAPIARVRRQTQISFLVMLFIAALAAWISVDTIVRPVSTLLAASRHFSESDFSTPLDIRGRDEIAELGRGFEIMRQRLASWSEEMEVAVQERTAQLSEYKNILDNLHEQVLVIDRDYRITNVNQPLLQLTGLQRSEVIGRYCYEVSHHSSIPCWQRVDGGHRCPAYEIWRNGQSAKATHLHYNAEGEPAWMDLVASPLLDDKGNIIAVIEACRDVTPEKRNAELLTSILKLSTELATMRHERELLEKLVTRGKDLAKSATFTVMLVDEIRKEACMIAADGLPPGSIGVRIPLNLPLLRSFMENGEPVIIPDIDRDAPEMRSILIRRDLQSFFAYPVIRKEGRPIGLITISRLTPHTPSRDEVTAYQLLAERTGAALENARLYADLQSLSVASIRSLTTAIDARDPYTRGHSDEVARLVMKLGRELAWEAEELEMLEFAALLHDVGKIAVSDLILSKNTPLSAEELSVIRTHPYYSAHIIKPILPMERIVPWVYHHHEWWDGAGYPEGLKGEDIPLASRMIALADAYNAMTTDRPYRSALSHEQAIQELEHHSGTQFDPRLTRVFLQVISAK